MIFKFEHAFSTGDADAALTGDRDFAELDRAIADCLDSQPVPQAVAAQVMIAFDELISNILNNRDADSISPAGAGPKAPRLTVEIEIGADHLSAEVADNGEPFDPLSLPEPDTQSSIEDREIGGLGVHLVRNLMENVSYSRKNGWNRLRFSKTFAIE